MNQILQRFKKWKNDPSTGRRVVAFGSSNTEAHWQYGWGDYIKHCLREWVGKHVSFTNIGIGGETTADLLERFDRDLVPLNPSIVYVTIGGNDMNSMDSDEYIENLNLIIRKIKNLNALPIYQTYYCLILKDFKAEKKTVNF